MNLFEAIKKNLELCLYYSNQTRIFNMKHVIVSCVAILIISSFLAYLFAEVKKIDEYVISAYWIITLTGILCSFIHTSMKTATIFVVTDCDIGEIIKKSAYFKSISFSMAIDTTVTLLKDSNIQRDVQFTRRLIEW